MGILPTVKSSLMRRDPKVFIMYGPPKVGKTTLISQLENNLILDFEGGTEYVNALAIQIIGWEPPAKETEDQKTRRQEEGLFYVTEAGREIIKEGKPYDFITIDTITEFEESLLPYAKKLYLQTPMGKKWEGDDVRTLAQGSGYLYLRLAFKEGLEKIKKLANNIILIGHIKDTFISKAGKEVSARELDLTGKCKQIACANADAIGYMHWGLEGEVLLNFQSSEELLCGARPEHLRGKEILMGKFNKELGVLEDVDWGRIYPDKYNVEN